VGALPAISNLIANSRPIKASPISKAISQDLEKRGDAV